jgi:hypothetical protein
LFTVAGDHVPEKALEDVVPKTGAVVPVHIDEAIEKVGVVNGFTVTDAE